MAIRQPVAYQAGTFPPPLLRAYETLPWLQDPAAGTIRPLSGVIPRGSGLDWPISQSGSTVTVGQGAAVVAGTEAAAQSGYEAINDAAMSFTIPAPPSGQTRRDRLGVRVRDAAYSGAATDGDVVLVQGVAASANPQLTAVPPNFMELLQVSTAGSGTPVVTPTWRYTGTAGGIRPSRAGTVDDGLAPMFAGQYRDCDGGLQRGTGPGGVWEDVAGAAEWRSFTPTLFYRGSGTDTAVKMGDAGFVRMGRYLQMGKTLFLRYVFRGSPGYDGGFGIISTRLPPGFVAASNEEQEILCKLQTVNINGNKATTGLWAGWCYVQTGTNMIHPVFPIGYDDCRMAQYRVATSRNAAATGSPMIRNTGSFPDLGNLVIQGAIEVQ